MKISDIRRARLKEWFADRTLPEKEKSYMSQLLSGAASFGEKAARRIEGEYGMTDGYLDRPIEPINTSQDVNYKKFTDDPIRRITANEIAELLSLYGKLSDDGRDIVMESIRTTLSVYAAPNNKRKTK